MAAISLSKLYFTDKRQLSTNAVTDDAIIIKISNAQSGATKKIIESFYLETTYLHIGINMLSLIIYT